MPPREIVGALAIAVFLRDVAARGDFRQVRLTPTWANGRPTVVARRIAADGALNPHGILVLDIAEGRIAGFDAFIDAKFLPIFGYSAAPFPARSP
jgi:hypothetical protein